MDSSTSIIQRGTNPVEDKRQPTDSFVIFVFLPVLLIWLAISISGFFFRQNTADKDDFAQVKELIGMIKWVINAPVERFSALLVLEIILSVLEGILFPLIYLIVIQEVSIFTIWFEMIWSVVSTIVSGVLITKSQMKEGDNINEVLIAAVVCFLSIRTISGIAGIVTVGKIGIDIPRKIILKFSQLALSSPALLIFPFLILVLEHFVILFTINAIQANLLSDYNVSLIAFFLTYSTFGGVIVLLFILNFALMVISGYIVNYYWMNGEKPQIGKIIVQVLRNHIGTIILSSVIPISIVCAIVLAFKHKPSWEWKENYIFYFISKVFLTLMMPVYALIFSSIYGTSFLTSSQKIFDVVLRRCLLFLATTWVLEGLTDIVILALIIISKRSKLMQEENFDIIMYSGASCAMSFFVLINIAVKALILNEIIISNQENECAEHVQA